MKIKELKIYTTEELSKIGEEKLIDLKLIAVKELNYIGYYTKSALNNSFLANKAIEMTCCARNADRSPMEKSIIAANIVFYNDEKVADILLKNGFNKDELQELLTLLQEFVKKESNREKITDLDKQIWEVVKNTLKRLLATFKIYCGIVNVDIILNKISQIITFNPELLEEKKTKNTRGLTLNGNH